MVDAGENQRRRNDGYKPLDFSVPERLLAASGGQYMIRAPREGSQGSDTNWNSAPESGRPEGSNIATYRIYRARILHTESDVLEIVPTFGFSSFNTP